MAPWVATACSDDADESSEAGRGSLTYHLAWIKNVEFAGNYIADQHGYYRDEGFDRVEFISGGPNVSQDAAIQAGKAFIGISAPDITGPAILAGADLVALGAQYQTNPFCITSLTDDPIGAPAEMIGRRIGIQAVNESVFTAYLAANDIAPGQVEQVLVQTDPQPLVNGDVDGWLGWITVEPILLGTQGIETHDMMLADTNYPLVSEIVVVKRSTLRDQRDRVKAVLRADIRGWQDSIADPALGARYAVDIYGKDLGLDVDEQTLESKAQNELILTDDTRANGLFTITDELMDASIRSLHLGGIDISAERLFDTSALEEVYDESPELRSIG
ncbi:MAG TPA: ABC transporter substrate-binding protein [Microthrixaceae bacterium]|nr:ABC transporter substrate-binding protein [Microthrixaceae bacterium]